jgi:probable O-glycosylation ligase (exosortase A-associated)
MLPGKSNKDTISEKNWFFYTLLFIIIDYGRPQDIMPIGFLRPAMIVNLILIFYIVKQGAYARYSSKQVKYVIYITLLLAIHVPFARNNHFAFQTAKNMLLYLPFILSVIATVTTIERLKTLITVLICLMIYVAGYSLTHGGVGSGNYFADENDVSLYINMYIPFCYFLFLHEKQPAKRIFFGIALILGLLAIILTFSRGGFVGLLAVAAIIWWGSPNKIISLLLILVLGTMFFFIAGDEYITEMGTVTDTSGGTAKERIESWKAGWRMFVDNPLGVGGRNFLVRFPEYQGEYFTHGMWGRAAHSLWFTLIPELGIIGIWLYMSLLYKNIKDIGYLRKLNNNDNNNEQRYLRTIGLAMLASLAGYFASGTFLSVLYYAHYWYLIPVIVVSINMATRIQESSELTKS